MVLLVISDDDFFLNSIREVLNQNSITFVGVNINSSKPDLNKLNDLPKKNILIKLTKQATGNILKVDRLINSIKGIHKIYSLSTLQNYEDQFEDTRQGDLRETEVTRNKHFQKKMPSPVNADFFISNLINYNLSRRETDVMILISGGCSYKEVASKLDLSIDTVRSHIKNVYAKLNVNSKSQAISKVMGYFISN